MANPSWGARHGERLMRHPTPVDTASVIGPRQSTHEIRIERRREAEELTGRLAA